MLHARPANERKRGKGLRFEYARCYCYVRTYVGETDRLREKIKIVHSAKNSFENVMERDPALVEPDEKDFRGEGIFLAWKVECVRVWRYIYIYTYVCV